MQRRQAQQFVDGRRLPTFQRRMQSDHELQQRRWRNGHIDQRLDRLQHPVERDHLGDQQIHHVGFEAVAVLQGAGHVRWELPRRPLPAPGAILDLCVDVMDDLSRTGCRFVCVVAWTAMAYDRDRRRSSRRRRPPPLRWWSRCGYGATGHRFASRPCPCHRAGSPRSRPCSFARAGGSNCGCPCRWSSP